MPPFVRFGPYCLALVMTACGSAPLASSEDVARSSAAITNGVDDTGDPAVVLLGDGGDSVCTGTVIAPLVIATAAHCLVFPPTTVHFGATQGKGTDITVAAVHLFPSYTGESFDGDVGVIILAEATDTAPIPLGTGALEATDVGQQVRVVGYGLAGTADGGMTAAEAPGTKRTGTASISQLDADDIELADAPSQPCQGDSGGPVLMTVGGTERLVGITSNGDANCTSFAHAIRMDVYASFFEEQIADTTPSKQAGCAVARGVNGPSGQSTSLFVSFPFLAMLVRRRKRKSVARR